MLIKNTYPTDQVSLMEEVLRLLQKASRDNISVEVLDDELQQVPDLYCLTAIVSQFDPVESLDLIFVRPTSAKSIETSLLCFGSQKSPR